MLGSGTASKPYIIQTPADLDAIRNNMGVGVYYELGNDIDMSGWGNFTPIGASSNRFKGRLDGKGYKIKNLTINSTMQYCGFISIIDNTSIVKNLFFENANVTSTSTHVAIVAGINVSSSTSKGTISNCVVTGKVTGSNLVASITASTGGLTENCYSFADVVATLPTGNVFGISRMDAAVNASIKNTYFAGELEGGNKYQVTGNANTMISGKYANNYYLNTLEGNDIWSTPLGTEQFKDSSNFPTFNTSIWGFGDMPYLLQFGEISKPVVARKVTVNTNTSFEPLINSCRAIRRIIRTNTNEILKMSHRLNKQLKTRSYSYIDELETKVKLLNAKVRQYLTHSSIDRIDSSVRVYKRSSRLLESLIESLRLSTSVLTLTKDIPVYANVYTLENNSFLFTNENQSVLFTNENQTELKVIK